LEPTLVDPEPHASRSRLTGAIKILVRIGVGLAVLAFIVLRHPAGLVSELKHAKPVWLAAAFASVLAGLFVSAFRWRVYLSELDLHLTTRALLRLYFVGTFFNAFLPTGIGGDGYKAIRLGRDRGSLSRAFASVFLDRFAGIVGLSAIGFTSTLVLVARHQRGPVVLLSLSLSGAIVLAALAVLVGGDRLAGLVIPDRGVFGKIRIAIRDIEQGGRSRTALLPGLGLGVVFQVLVLAYHLAVAKALGIRIGIAQMSAIVVIASLATMIPVTINGLGFRESSYKWALHKFGAVPAGSELGGAFAILILAVLIFSSAVGGVVYLIAGGEITDRDAPAR
jgi:glycosyltransferase 2 family protein